MTHAPRNTFASRFSGLYWKLSGILLVILIVLAIANVYITTFTAEMYYQEAGQRLNASVAPYVAARVPLINRGVVDRNSLKTLFTDVMTINPSLEVYLLDTTGSILAYSAPDSLIRRRSVSLVPIQLFLRNGASHFQMGDDPRGERREKVFSAAAIAHDGRAEGYLYVILGGEEYDSSVNMLLESYILRLASRTIILTLLGAAALGLLGFGVVTRSLRRAIATVRQFQGGDHSVRIAASTTPEFNELGMAFNEMADEIVRRMEEIKSMDRLRRDLVANVSHDLRTPIVSIHGYVETILMKDALLTAEQRNDYLRTVLKSTDRLRRLVEELLELSKLEAKEIVPRLERFSVAELVQDVVQKYGILAETRGVRLNVEFPRTLPFVVADIGLIERVFQNLLDNAIHYTPAGGTVTIALREEGEGVNVHIEDTGEGIPAADLSRIFERFERGAKADASGRHGTGLGLAIVKKILDVHGVSISVSSTMLEGTTFSFSLPGKDSAAPELSESV